MSSETEVTDAIVTDEKQSEEGSNKINEDSNGDNEEDTDVIADKDEEEAEGERVRFVTTACGDYHNLAIDSSGDLP